MSHAIKLLEPLKAVHDGTDEPVEMPFGSRLHISWLLDACGVKGDAANVCIRIINGDVPCDIIDRLKELEEQCDDLTLAFRLARQELERKDGDR